MPARRNFVHLLWLWLCTAMVLGHALAPIGSPLARVSGSAFSAATADVSLGPSRGALGAKLKRAQDQGEEASSAGSDPSALAPAAAALSLFEPETPRLRGSAPPPPAARSSRPFDARAPPRA